MRTALVIILAGTLLAGCGAPEVRAAKAAVKGGLKDPSSAQFKDVRRCDGLAKGEIVRGEVNGRNSYGGYSGFTKFIYRPATGEVVMPEALGLLAGDYERAGAIYANASFDLEYSAGCAG